MVNEFDVKNPDKEELKKIYNDRTRFNSHFSSLGGYKNPYDKYRMHAVIEAVRSCEPRTILDNGCGACLIGSELARRGYKVTGSDISWELLKQVPRNKNLNLVAGDSEELPFKDSSFDCVVCSEVLEHLKDHKKAAKEIARVMRRGGLAVITIPNMFCYDSLEGSFGIISKSIATINFLIRILRMKPVYQYGHNTHLNKMLPSQWKALLESAGLKVDKERAVFLSPYLPERMQFLERAVYELPGLFHLKTWVDDWVSGVWPFKYLGISHLFVCRKTI